MLKKHFILWTEVLDLEVRKVQCQDRTKNDHVMQPWQHQYVLSPCPHPAGANFSSLFHAFFDHFIIIDRM